MELRPGREDDQTVLLPLGARPRPVLHWAYGIGLVMFGALGGVLLASLLLRPNPTLIEVGVGVALGGFMFIWASASGLSLIFDAVRGTGLTVSSSGFYDGRTGADVAWEEIRSAEYRYSRVGVGGLALTLANPRSFRQNPFRVGFDRRRRNELVVPLKFLSTPPSVLSFIFETLIEAAGGQVTAKPPHR